MKSDMTPQNPKSDEKNLGKQNIQNQNQADRSSSSQKDDPAEGKRQSSPLNIGEEKTSNPPSSEDATISQVY